MALTNGDFETGDLTGWTVDEWSDPVSVTTGSKYSGTYGCLHETDTSGNQFTLIAQEVGAIANGLNVSIWWKGSSYTGDVGIYAEIQDTEIPEQGQIIVDSAITDNNWHNSVVQTAYSYENLRIVIQFYGTDEFTLEAFLDDVEIGAGFTQKELIGRYDILEEPEYVPTPSNFQWRKPLFTDYEAGYGGPMGTETYTSGSENAMFSDVQNAERLAGTVDYRVLYLHSATMALHFPKVWIDYNTVAPHDYIEIVLTKGMSRMGQHTATGLLVQGEYGGGYDITSTDVLSDYFYVGESVAIPGSSYSGTALITSFSNGGKTAHTNHWWQLTAYQDYELYAAAFENNDFDHGWTDTGEDRFNAISAAELTPTTPVGIIVRRTVIETDGTALENTAFFENMFVICVEDDDS